VKSEKRKYQKATWGEASFLTVEEEAVPTTSVSKKYVSSTLNRAGTPEEGSSSKSEYEEFPASMDQLKARVYSPRKYQKATWGYWKDYQEKLTKDRKGH
jgi:hypothetical protein